MDCVAPPSKGGDAIHQCPRADSRLLRGIFDHWRNSEISFRVIIPITLLPSFMIITCRNPNPRNMVYARDNVVCGVNVYVLKFMYLLE